MALLLFLNQPSKFRIVSRSFEVIKGRKREKCSKRVKSRSLKNKISDDFSKVLEADEHGFQIHTWDDKNFACCKGKSENLYSLAM